MRILIIGAGAIGGVYAERLHQTGCQVTVTARGEHLHAIQQQGLHITHNGDDRPVKLPAYGHQQLQTLDARVFDLIIVTLKANHTAHLLTELGNWLSQADTPILSLQNGVDNEPLLAKALGQDRIMGGLSVQSGGEVVSPGVIHSTGIYKVILGKWPAQMADTPDCVQRLAQHLKSASIPVEISCHIQYELWRKLVINNGVNPLSAIVELDTYQLTHRPELACIVRGMMRETASAAQADGVKVTAQDVDDMFDVIQSFDPIKTSMLIDKQKGRPLELDAIVGSVLSRSKQQGFKAPYNQCMWGVLQNIIASVP